MLNEKSITPAPDKFSARTDAENRDYVYRQLTGQPAPRHTARYEECDHCGGTCEVYSRRCPTCKGKGRIRVTDKAAQCLSAGEPS